MGSTGLSRYFQTDEQIAQPDSGDEPPPRARAQRGRRTWACRSRSSLPVGRRSLSLSLDDSARIYVEGINTIIERHWSSGWARVRRVGLSSYDKLYCRAHRPARVAAAELSSFHPQGERIPLQSYRRFPPAISVASFAVCQTRPLVYFLKQSWTEQDGLVGGDWDALYRFALDADQPEVVARNGALIPPDHYDTAWLALLHSVADDVSRVFCTAALRRAEGPIYYCLSELSIADRTLATVTKLEAIFA